MYNNLSKELAWRKDYISRIALLLIEISLVLMFVFTDGKLYYQPFLVEGEGGWWGAGLINCLRLILKSTGRIYI